MASAVRRVEDDSAQAWRRRKKLILGDKRKALAAASGSGPFLTRIDEGGVSQPRDETSR